MMNFVNTDNINLVCVASPALYISSQSHVLSSTITHLIYNNLLVTTSTNQNVAVDEGGSLLL